jgi:hypothetical protein
MARVRVEGAESGQFELRRGLKQGSVFAPLLFNIFFGAIIHAFHGECNKETNIKLGLNFNVNWRNNFVLNKFVDQRIRKQSILHRPPPESVTHLMEILFADDCELFAESEEALQKMVDVFVKVSSAFAQEVSVKKTKVLVVQKCLQGSERIVPAITINGALLENVEEFVYLGSKESNLGDMAAESAVREQRMRTAFSQWEGRVLMNPHLSRHLRLKFFNLIVVSNGIYGCATWNLTKKQIHDLESIQLRLLKKVCGVRDDSRASYQDVMKIAERAGCPVVPLGCTIAKLQLRYLGHVERMRNSRIQRRILYGQLHLPKGKKKKGAPARNYRKAIADALKNFGYSPTQWQVAIGYR